MTLGYPIPTGIPVTPSWQRAENEDPTPTDTREAELWQHFGPTRAADGATTESEQP